MRLFLDSSAYAKRFIEEEGSQKIDDMLLQASGLGLSIICFPEIISALARRLREKNISKRDYSLARQRLTEEISDIQIINITPQVVAGSVRLLESNILRTMDALHIACALEWEPDLFITSDKQQAKAAEKVKLQTRYIE